MATGQLTQKEANGIWLLVTLCTFVLSAALQGEAAPIITSIALTGFAFAATYALIIKTGPNFIKAGLKGVDMSKKTKKEIPECAGAICAIVFLLIVTAFIPFAFFKDIVAATSGGGNRDVVEQAEHVNQGRFLHKFPHNKVSNCYVSVLSLSFKDTCCS